MSQLFLQPFVQAPIKENIKATRHLPFCLVWPLDSSQKGPAAGKLHLFDDVIMLTKILPHHTKYWQPYYSNAAWGNILHCHKWSVWIPPMPFKRFPDSKVHFTLRTRNSVHDSCFVSVINVQSMVCANVRIHYGLQVVLVWLQVTPQRYHYYALIWTHWNTKMSVTYILSSICLRFSQFSQLSFI